MTFLRPATLVLLLSASLAGCVTTGTTSPDAKGAEAAKTTATSNELDHKLSGQQTPPKAFERAEVTYKTKEAPGTIIIDTKEKHLYLVEGNDKAMRYGVGVGREGFGWKGTVNIGSKQEWPRWFPPKEMIARERARGHMIPDMMEGQVGNPLGARAMYLYDGGKDTLFRIHGTFEPNSIGTNASSGCIRMANYDVIDLYDRVKVGTKVIVQ